VSIVSDHRALACRTAPRFVLVALAVAASLVVATTTRIVLAAMHAAGSGGSFAASLRILGAALALGPLSDAAAALWLAAPLAVLLALLPGRPRRWQRGLVQLAVAALVATTLFVAVAEVVFFSEFDSRFNFVAVDYLIYPTEVAANIGESYPIGWALLGIALVTALVLRASRGVRRRVLAEPAPRAARLRFAAGYAVLLAATFLLSPKLTRVSDDRAVNEIAASGYATFLSALLGRDAPYDGLYATRPDTVVFPRLHRLLREDATDTASFAADATTRHIGAAGPQRRLNVVVVLEESLGAGFVGALHPSDSTLTPRFDSLAAEGTLLTRAYSTGNRTIRALEATTSSLPPLPGISIVRRSASRDLFTLPSLLRARGYATQFVYGGRALFDGMGGYALNNGIERVVEQRDFPDDAFTTAWGVADEVIFDRALAEMDSLHATGAAFYSLILTVSNHRPYDYPGGRIDADPAARRREHAVRYADWALGRFLRQAREHPFFDSTLFVLMGDHGPRVYGAAEIPLPSYEVPILLYGPGIVPAGRRIETIASSLDVPPTILGIIGGSYESSFFGRDIRRTPPAEGRALMTHGSEVALLRGDRMAVLGLRGEVTVYRYDHSAETLSPLDSSDDEARALVEDAIAYYHGADEMYRAGRYTFPVERRRIVAVRSGD
jgi:phosphoglycerol transferase MdoB-like AlkP superfamily enzyme